MARKGVEIIKVTNGEAIRNGLIPCETNPETGRLSRTRERFHAEAEVTVGGQMRLGRVRVCRGCAEVWHKKKVVEEGVRFP